ncbi:hypothetical protein NMG60_11005013 [Bertholletia excelsa]
MSAEKKAVTVRDLAEEAKKRIVFLSICVVGLSYLMSLTSSSVWVNLPIAAFLIVILRYWSLDFEMRRKAAIYNSRPTLASISSQKKPLESPISVVEKSDWRRKVNSPVVEEAIDHFTRHLVSEWVTDLWYSRITPDRQGPEELVQIINGVFGEISSRMRNVNLIDLLTRDIINLLCTHLELFRASQTKIEKKHPGILTFERRDKELKVVLYAENKLHPALFSPEAEHKVLQHLMDGLISFTFRPEDLQCSLFHYIVRELLACAVMKPVLNLANPRFINERIESLAVSLSKANKGPALQSLSKSNGSSRISSDDFSPFLDPSVKGVELVQFKKAPFRTAEEESTDIGNETLLSKDSLLSIDTRSIRSHNSLSLDPHTRGGNGIERHHSGHEWADMLDMMSRRKTQALAPDHLENMWTKGRNYRKKEGSNQVSEPVRSSSSSTAKKVDNLTRLSRQRENGATTKINFPKRSDGFASQVDQPTSNKLFPYNNWNMSGQTYVSSYEDDDDDDDDENDVLHLQEVGPESSGSFTGEDDENSFITGLDSPGTKVWDAKHNRKLSVSHIHHPLESSDACKARKTGKGEVPSILHRTLSGRKRSRLSSQKMNVWQEVERTSFLSGDGKDVLNSFKEHVKSEESGDDSESEVLGRVHSGANISSSVPLTSTTGSHGSVVNAHKNSLLADSFLKLRCEVLGANIVKSGSKTFAVYCISVTDMYNNNWSIKRRFRHFEELHQRLKEFMEYNLHLPPKYFLSAGLDVSVILERCKLLDQYLKRLLQLPTISGSIEVWDFLSVDSQTYIFSNSISIIETLSVGLGGNLHERSKEVQSALASGVDPSLSGREQRLASTSPVKHNFVADGSKLNTKGPLHSPQKVPPKESGKPLEDSGSDSDYAEKRNISQARKPMKGTDGDNLQTSNQLLVDAATDPTLPTEWVPPNLSIPILDMVDVIFQLQDGGWIRRKAFWVAKQVLQLGMGDAFDDWLIEKIQLLRKGTVVASGVKRIEQILWPDGIFITKRQRPNTSGTTLEGSPHAQPPNIGSSPKKREINQLDEQQQQEAEQRAKFVYELMIDKAPATIVGLVGRKEYEQSVKDLYYFLQSSACLKHLAFDLLQLLLSSAFPEMDHVFKKLHDEKEKFGVFPSN